MKPGEPKLTLVAAEHSYFSAKARSYLRYKGTQGVFFKENLATLDMYRKVILPLVGVNFIPVLLVHNDDGTIKEAIQDTSLIIDYVEHAYPELLSVHPTQPKQRFVSYLIELWADEHLKFPAMHYRWSFLEENKKYLVHEWGRAGTPLLPAMERDKMVLESRAKGPSFSNMMQTLPLLGITDKTIPEIERSFLHLLELLDTHFRQYRYLLGDRPCLGDFALVGPMNAHLYRDPKPSAIIRSRAPAFCEYLERMNGLRPAYDVVMEMDDNARKLVPVPGSALTGGQLGRVPSFGEFLPNDEIPASLLPVVEKIFSEHVPILLSTCKQLKRAFESSTSFTQVLPRTTGFHKFTLGNSTQEEQRLAYPYDVWMLQRCMDSVDKPGIVHPFIEKFTNGPQLLQSWKSWINPELRLRLVNFKLYRDPAKPPQLVQSKL